MVTFKFLLFILIILPPNKALFYKYKYNNSTVKFNFLIENYFTKYIY